MELLYFHGCPHAESYAPHLREMLAPTPHELVEREVPDEDAASEERFLGSPTVRVDGRDVEPGATERSDFGLSCRLYITDDGPRGTPLDRWVRQALREITG